MDRPGQGVASSHNILNTYHHSQKKLSHPNGTDFPDHKQLGRLTDDCNSTLIEASSKRCQPYGLYCEHYFFKTTKSLNKSALSDSLLAFMTFFNEPIGPYNPTNKTYQQCCIDKDYQIGSKNHHYEMERIFKFIGCNKKTDTVRQEKGRRQNQQALAHPPK